MRRNTLRLWICGISLCPPLSPLAFLLLVVDTGKSVSFVNRLLLPYLLLLFFDTPRVGTLLFSRSNILTSGLLPLLGWLWLVGANIYLGL